jgi:glycopeptide antibiotics resistance protein
MIKGISLDSSFVLVVGVLFWMVIRGLVLFKNKKYKRLSVPREMLLNIFAVYIVSLLSITLFPIYIIWGEVVGKFRPAINMIPFVDIITDFPRTQFSLAFKIKFLIKNLMGNLVLLLPFGLFLPILWNMARSFWTTVVMGVLLSSSIEILQYVLAYFGYGGRAADIDDLILNTLGVVIGYFIFEKGLARFNFYMQLGMSK